MNLYSYTFPVKLENSNSLPTFEFVAPYTITTALHIENSHYVGYTINDSKNNSVDVLNIQDLKKYIKTYPNEFTNAIIDELTGQLEIVNIQKLTHKESIEFLYEYERRGFNNGLVNLLEVVVFPRKFYSYDLYLDKCSLTKEAREYLNTKGYNNDKVIIPPPLLISNDNIVKDASGLFSNLEPYEKDIDFTLVNFKYYLNLYQLFKSSKIKSLDIKTFNINSSAKMKEFCYGIECDTLSTKDCDFSEMYYFTSAFEESKINEFQSIGCNMKNLSINSTNNIFTKSTINKLDLGLFEKVKVAECSNLSKHLLYSNYEEIINEELLPKKLFLTESKMKNSKEYCDEARKSNRRGYYRQGIII